jgi:hypothetical protein
MRKLYYFSLIWISFIINGCNVLSNGTSYFTIEKTLETSVYGMGLPLNELNGEPRELGLSFVVHQPSKIVAIRLKNPEIGNKRVSLWNTNNRALIATFMIQVTNTLDNYHIVQIPLEQGQTYTLSMNCTTCFYHQLPLQNLPISNEKITLLSASQIDGSWQQFPYLQNLQIVHGLIDFDLQYIIK